MRGAGAALLALAFLLAPARAEPLSIMPQPAKTERPVQPAALPPQAPVGIDPFALPPPAAAVAPASEFAPAASPSAAASPAIPQAVPVISERALPVYEPRPLQGRKKINVVVFGDSLGDGVWAGLYHLLRQDKRFNVIRRSRVATGFVRQDYFNWNEEVKAAASETRIDIAVVVMGTNDRQVIVDGRKRYALFEPKWREIYEKRVDAFTSTLQETGAHIYWMQLPVMRQARFENDMQGFNEIFETRANTNNVHFVKTRNLAIDENGAYTAYGDDLRGRKKLLRAEDGIHFTMPGYELIASPIAALILEAAGPAPSGKDMAQGGFDESDVTGSIHGVQTAGLRDAPASATPLPRLDDGSLLRPGRSDDWRWRDDVR